MRFGRVENIVLGGRSHRIAGLFAFSQNDFDRLGEGLPFRRSCAFVALSAKMAKPAGAARYVASANM